ncbi:MAG: Bax inhibitor-1/YccA family protein [Parachlamydiaceae bacterium]|nr:Bax inhibitor-1/YccA family protein [Parachlamydiaceae bacterium]
MRSSNPALMSNAFSGFGLVSESNTMTVKGTINKTAILLLLVLLPAAWTWRLFFQAGGNIAAVQTWMMIGLFGGLGFSIATIFKRNWAPITAPLYAVMQGLFLGSLSAMFEASYPGLVIQAVSLSMATLLIMLVAYQSGWVRATDNFKLGVFAATGGIAVVYFVAMIMGFFGVNVPFITGSSWFSIGFSVFVVVIAALNFIIDFDFIEQGARGAVPKYMEWYGAFALMVTLIWLYVEILRLLAKLNDRK